MDGKKLLAILAAVFTALGTIIGLIAAPDGGTTKTKTVKVAREVAPAPAGDLQAEKPDSAKEATGETPAESDLRDDTPEGVSAEALQQGRAKTEAIAKDVGVADNAQPVGGAQGYTVRQDFSGHVYSDFYSNVTPTEFCLHYTVSSNITGWGDVLSIRDYFKRTKGASATYIADFEGHILQMVPLNKKAWTQGGFNPYCRASVEMIATGRETRAQWLAAPLIKRGILAALMRDVMGKYRLPLKFVDPVGCVAPAGYTDHDHIECGNSHTDVAPTFPFDVLKKQLAERPKPVCRRACQLRAKHKRTHARFRKNECGPKKHGYCDTLRSRNKAVHKAAKKEHVKL